MWVDLGQRLTGVRPWRGRPAAARRTTHLWPKPAPLACLRRPIRQHDVRPVSDATSYPGTSRSQAWWVHSASRIPGRTGVEVIAGGWRDWILTDVGPSGSEIITVPHDYHGPLLVRSFPSLEVVRSVEPPSGEHWDCDAFFAGDMIVSTLRGEEDRVVAINRRGKIEDLDQPEALYIFPADHGTWLEIGRTTVRRRGIVDSGDQVRGQMALW